MMQYARGRSKMDRVGSVDTVDSIDGPEVSLADSLAESSTGWDAYAVWRDRVHGARERAHSSGARATTVVRSAQQESVTTGWDPREIWQGRVRGARAKSRS